MEKIRWTKKSVADLKNIFDYISLDSEFYATRFVNQLIQQVEQLKKFPISGRVVPELMNPNIRELITGNYRIFYRQSKHHVTILRVHHSSRNIQWKLLVFLAFKITHHRFPHQSVLFSWWQFWKFVTSFEMGPTLLVSTDEFVIAIRH